MRSLDILNARDLVLEPLAERHADEMFDVLCDPAIYEFENAPPQSLEWLRARYRRLESCRSADGSEHWLNWVVRLPSGALAGYVQATVCGDDRAFVAYELASRFWRQGIGRAAVRALLDELAARHAVRTCLAVFKARNFRSEALLRSLGFQAPAAGAAPPVECEPDERVMVKLLVAHAGDAA